jgi:hypothetical protein
MEETSVRLDMHASVETFPGHSGRPGVKQAIIACGDIVVFVGDSVLDHGDAEADDRAIRAATEGFGEALARAIKHAAQ